MIWMIALDSDAFLRKVSLCTCAFARQVCCENILDGQSEEPCMKRLEVGAIRVTKPDAER